MVAQLMDLLTALICLVSIGTAFVLTVWARRKRCSQQALSIGAARDWSAEHCNRGKAIAAASCVLLPLTEEPLPAGTFIREPGSALKRSSISTCTDGMIHLHSPSLCGYPRDGVDFQPGPALRVACSLLLKAALWVISPIGAKDAGIQVCKTVAGIDPRWSTLSTRDADTGALHKKAVYAVGAPQKLRAVVTEALPIPEVYTGLVLQFDRGLQICKRGGKAPNLNILSLVGGVGSIEVEDVIVPNLLGGRSPSANVPDCLEQTSSHKPTILQAEQGQPINQSCIDRIFSYLPNEGGCRRGLDKHARSFPTKLP